MQSSARPFPTQVASGKDLVWSQPVHSGQLILDLDSVLLKHWISGRASLRPVHSREGYHAGCTNRPHAAFPFPYTSASPRSRSYCPRRLPLAHSFP
jgi:hypothetical protein